MATKNITVSLVIPLYNNASTAKTLLEESVKALEKATDRYEIILCNDASTDTTAEIIKKFAVSNKRVRIITHDVNKGIAPTLRELYSQAKGIYTLLFSVDDGWDPKDITSLINSHLQSGAGVTIGQRIKKQYPLVRKVISFFYNALPNLLWGLKTYDVGSIKIFNTALYNHFSPRSKSVFFEVEFLRYVAKHGYTITSIPVSHRAQHVKKKSGVTIKTVREALRDALMLTLVP